MIKFSFNNWTENDILIYNQILTIFEEFSEEELPTDDLEKILKHLDKMLKQ